MGKYSIKARTSFYSLRKLVFVGVQGQCKSYVLLHYDTDKVLPFSSCGRPWRAALLQTPSFLHSLSSAMASLNHSTTNQNLFVHAGKSIHFLNLNVGLPVLWKNPVKVSCRFEDILQDKRLDLKPLHAFDPFSHVQKMRVTNQEHLTCEIPDPLLTSLLWIADHLR